VFGKVTNIADYGAFVEIEDGVEGLVHVSEMDWTNKNVNPAKVVHTGQEVEVMVLDVDEERRRISLGLKQCQANPWKEFAENYNKGDKVAGQIKSITDFGIFIGLQGNIDGLVHLSDISWDQPGEEAVRNYQKGQQLEAMVLSIDPERERISLGIKQLAKDPFSAYIADNPKARSSRCGEGGRCPRAVIDLGNGVEGQLRASELGRERVEDARAVLKVGDEVEAKFTGVDRKSRTISLSIKAKEAHEEAEAVQSYRSETAPSGTTLGICSRSTSVPVSAERMTKSELIEIITAKQKHLPAKDVELALKQILEIMSDALSQGERIEIRGFGSFSLHFRPPRQGRNPRPASGGALGQARSALQARQGSARAGERRRRPTDPRLSEAHPRHGPDIVSQVFELPPLLLALAFVLVGLAAYFLGRRNGAARTVRLPRDYYVGLDHLINDRFDHAAEIFARMAEADGDAAEIQFALGACSGAAARSIGRSPSIRTCAITAAAACATRRRSHWHWTIRARTHGSRRARARGARRFARISSRRTRHPRRHLRDPGRLGQGAQGVSRAAPTVQLERGGSRPLPV